MSSSKQNEKEHLASQQRRVISNECQAMFYKIGENECNDYYNYF